MFKRIIRDIKHSNRRNPIKLVLVGLIILIAANLVFSGLALNRGISEKIDKLHDYNLKTIELKYKDESIVPDGEKTKEGLPLLYDKDLFKVMGGENFFVFSSSHVMNLLPLSKDDEGFNQEKYDKGIDSLGLSDNGMHIEVRSKYGNKYLNWPTQSYYDYDYSLFDHIDVVEGRKFLESDDSKIIVPQSLYEEESLNIGDTIEFSNFKKYYPFEIVGVYTKEEPSMSDDIIYAQGGEEQFHEMRSHKSVEYQVISESTFKIDERDNENSNPDEILKSWNKYLDENFDNYKVENTVEKYAGFIVQLKMIQGVSVVGIMLSVLLSIYLISNILKNDAKVNHDKDLHNSIYEDDRKVIKISNYLQVSLITVVAVGISLFTAPALNDMFMSKTVALTLEFVNDFDPLLDFEEHAFDNAAIGGESELRYSRYPDIQVIAQLEYKPTALTTALLVVIMTLTSTGAVYLTNKSIDKKE